LLEGDQTFPGFPEMLTRPVDLGYPDIQIAGYDGIGGSTSLPMQRHNNTFQVADDLAWHPALNRGIHQLSFGADILHIANNSYIDEFSRGFYSFLGVTGNSVEDLLLGLPSVAISVSGNTSTNLRTSDIAFYAQDDIQFHPRFTVNAGLRYEASGPPFDAGNRLSIPDFSSNSGACTPKPDCMFLLAGTNGIPRGLYRANHSDFAPRIGFAWRPSAAIGSSSVPHTAFFMTCQF
jgi:outer membrane receptor protein involved in Fe transport